MVRLLVSEVVHTGFTVADTRAVTAAVRVEMPGNTLKIFKYFYTKLWSLMGEGITSADADGSGGGGGAGAADHAGAGGDGGGDVSGEGGAGHHRLHTLGAPRLSRLLLAVALGRGVNDKTNLGSQMVRRD